MIAKAPLTHLNARGEAHIVDIGNKSATHRRAVAEARLEALPETIAAIVDGSLKKGDALAVARIAGIMAAKRTSDLIPLCHPLPIDSVTVNFSFPDDTSIRVETAAACSGKTGIEMEALVAASAAALTIYDMCKAAQRDIVIEQLQLEEKSGGRSGHWVRSSV